MKTECLQYLKNPYYWTVIGLGLAARAGLACLDFRYRGPQFWELSADFWNKTGSVTMGFLILLVIIRRFSYDTELRAFHIINSTAYGRLSLFWNRLIGGEAAAAAAVLFLYAGNIGISFLLGSQIGMPDGWTGSFSHATLAALVGSLGYFTMSAMICDLAKNHPIAMCLCGLPFASSYFINADAVKPPDLFWLLRYGFFTELVRGRTIKSFPAFWFVWYMALIGLTLLFVIRKRKERKEL
ncbi:hypothetical protein AALA83_16730 [Oscillospiraceae bacterium 44-5]